MFPKSKCSNSITIWTKANFLCGHNPTITLDDLNAIYSGGTISILTDYNINQSNCNFSKLKLTWKFDDWGWIDWGIFKKDKYDDVLDLSKCVMCNMKVCLAGREQGSYAFGFPTIKTIKNLTLEDWYRSEWNWDFCYTSTKEGDHLQNILNIKVINSYFKINDGTKTIKNLTFVDCKHSFKSVGVSTCTSLTKESLINLLNALQTLKNETRQCALGSVNLAKLTDEEIAIATKKGWTLA